MGQPVPKKENKELAMGHTYKDRQKSDRPTLLKNQHKGSRQVARSFKQNYMLASDEDEVNASAFQPTEEELQDYQEYLKSKKQQEEDFIDD